MPLRCPLGQHGPDTPLLTLAPLIPRCLLTVPATRPPAVAGHQPAHTRAGPRLFPRRATALAAPARPRGPRPTGSAAGGTTRRGGFPCRTAAGSRPPGGAPAHARAAGPPARRGALPAGPPPRQRPFKSPAAAPGSGQRRQPGPPARERRCPPGAAPQRPS